jgi:hypothetical protein
MEDHQLVKGKTKLLFVVWCASGLLDAHDVPTHHAITTAAIQYLASTLGTDDATLRDCLPTIEQLVQIGTGDEDLAPGNRFMFHFSPRLHDTVRQFGEVVALCSSLEWAFSVDSNDLVLPNASKPCVHNQPVDYNSKWSVQETASTVYLGKLISMKNEHTWKAAVEAGRSADIKTRQSGWIHLGYVIHLLQDLTSPAHTRSDAHPPVDSDPIERVALRLPAYPLGRSLVELPVAEDYFKLLREWTQSRFFSKNTVFAGTNADGEIIAGPSAARLDDSGYVFDAENRPIAYLGKSAQAAAAFGFGPEDILRRGTIDDFIATEQWKELGPQAVLYTASLIYHFYKEIGKQTPCEPSQVSCVEAAGEIAFIRPGFSDPYLPGVKEGDQVTFRFSVNPKTAVVTKYDFPTVFIRSYIMARLPNKASLQIGPLRFIQRNDMSGAATEWNTWYPPPLDAQKPTFRFTSTAPLVPVGLETRPIQTPADLEELYKYPIFDSLFRTTREGVLKSMDAPLPSDYSIFDFSPIDPSKAEQPRHTFEIVQSGPQIGRSVPFSGTVKYLGVCRGAP